ncbi:DUF3800 domain-containing protein [Patescibacteria group bacterium]|nr:DUF3800 domain-containing protein [Patescibacteria group bacterium]MCG2694855.1 DUF3800 domain-containing protein [Candidatus Parcubacteria bacterium]
MLDKFFKKDNRKLTLADYKKIWTPFCFLDESGTLGVKDQPYFTVGMIKCSQPYFLQQKIRYIREKNNFWWEFKFNGLNQAKIKTVLEVLDILFNTRSIHFSSYTIDKRNDYFKKEFNNDSFVAYEQITKHLLEGNLRKNEVLIVLADNVVSPKRNRFELNVKNHINNKFKRLAVAGVCRLNSQTNDLLQLADLLIGSVNYELLLKEKIITTASKNKGKLVDKFKENLGVDTLTNDFRNYAFNIRYHKDDEKIECNDDLDNFPSQKKKAIDR